MKSISVTAGELAVKLGCRLEGDAGVILTGAAPIEEAQPDQITFLANPRYRKHLTDCHAGAIIIAENEETPTRMARLVSSRSYVDFCRALEILYPIATPKPEPGVHPTAIIHPTATLGEDLTIGAGVVVAEGAAMGRGSVVYPGAYIGHDARMGEDCIVGINAVVRHDVVIGNRVVIGDGSVIGFDGFGYAPTGRGDYRKIPQVGTVIIADDVEIGANCCIDRATVGATRIGRGTKLDNLIQVAHGVHIGEDTVIAAQTGISGSAKVGSRVMMGGQVGMVGHIEVGDDMIVGAQAGVSKSFNIKGMISGYPARPQQEELRMEAAVQRLPELMKRVQQLEEKLKDLSK